MTEWQDSHSARPQDAPKGWRTGKYAMNTMQRPLSGRTADSFTSLGSLDGEAGQSLRGSTEW
jgi:hypothetical protein